MKKKMAVNILVVMAMTIILSACAGKNATSAGNIIFTDDLGNKITLKSPAKRIISLYSVHTENLFSLGLNKEILGVGTSDTYPEQVKSKKVFDYRGDAETIIKENPDVVLMRTTISKSYPDFVKTLQDAGIQVVSLYPNTFSDFDKYIEKLALLTGKEKEAKAKLDTFHKELDQLKAKSDKIAVKKKVFLETTEKEYKTCAKNSFAWTSMEIAGSKNIAENAKADKNSPSYSAFGEEKLLSMANDIDLYIAQKGAMNPNVSENLIKKRPGFNKIKAIKDDKIVVVDEKLVSGATFRFVTGVTELQKAMYPELYK